MKRYVLLVAIPATIALVGCSSPQVVAEATFTDDNTGQSSPLADLPVRLLPYDRDAIFDSLQQAFPEPEPPIPPELLALQDSVIAAEETWRQIASRDSVMADSVATLSAELERMQQANETATPAYRQAFAAFQSLEDRANAVNQQMSAAFEHFDQLQQQLLEAAEQVRVARDMWAERAFADFETILEQKLEESGREELADTTDAQGRVLFEADDGRWWLYARYTLPFSELYWNVPVDVNADSVTVQLNNQNAEERPIL